MNDEAHKSVPQPRSARIAEVLLIALVFFVVAGDPAPHTNEPHYLCRLKHYWNPAWCAGDLFLDSPEAHLTFVWVFGWVTKWSLAATAWTGRAAAWTLLAWAWQRLSLRIVPAPFAAVLAAALWVSLTQTAHLAGEWVIGGVEAKCFAYVFVLLALRELVDRRWNRVWLALGAATALHALVGGWSTVICGGIWCLETLQCNSARRDPLRSFRAMLPGLVGGGLLALVGVVPALLLTWNEPRDVVAEANQIYVFERLPHHLALLSLPGAEIARRLTRHGLLIAALWLLSSANRRLGNVDAGLATVTRFAWGAVLIAAIGLVLELALWSHPALAAALLRYYWFRLTDVAVPLAVALQVVALIAAGLSQYRSWAAWGLVAALVAVGGHLTQICRERLVNPVPPSDRRMLDPAAWVEACEWVAENTPPDALFLTPRLNQSFKWRTGRPEVATRKDVPQDARSMVEWFHRLRTIYYAEVDGELEPAPSLAHVGTERVLAAARQYGAKYVLTDNRHPLQLPIAYPNATHANDTYVIYRIDD